MDVAKHLAQWQEQSPEQWVRAANRYLPTAVTFALVIVIAYQLSRITWAVVPGAVPVAAPASRAPNASPAAAAPSPGYGALTAAHLFGEAPKESAQQPLAQEVVDAPDTTLSLTLTGILSHEGDPNGQAIISSNRGQEKTYQIGQAVDNANGTTLHSVYADRVLLNRGDRLETLRLPKELAAAGAPQRAPTPMMAPAATPAGGDSLRNVISQNATRLTDILRLAPHIQEGQVVGFRVNPGRDRESFEALGLLPGDVVTDINGVVLDDASRGLQAFEALGEATMANVTVLRDGTPTVLVIDTSQLQNLQENRE
jgi:general secretion pathway protein C